MPPTTTRETTPTGEELELGRRASTGEMDTPSKVSSAVSPPPIMENGEYVVRAGTVWMWLVLCGCGLAGGNFVLLPIHQNFP